MLWIQQSQRATSLPQVLPLPPTHSPSLCNLKPRQSNALTWDHAAWPGLAQKHTSDDGPTQQTLIGCHKRAVQTRDTPGAGECMCVGKGGSHQKEKVCLAQWQDNFTSSYFLACIQCSSTCSGGNWSLCKQLWALGGVQPRK